MKTASTMTKALVSTSALSLPDSRKLGSMRSAGAAGALLAPRRRVIRGRGGATLGLALDSRARAPLDSRLVCALDSRARATLGSRLVPDRDTGPSNRLDRGGPKPRVTRQSGRAQNGTRSR